MEEALPHPLGRLQEHPSTYVIQDRSNQKEMTRLEVQDELLTTGMGGVLPELADPTLLRQVLDVGSGTGGWLIETAKTYPSIEKLVGVDISNTMVTHASAQATSALLDGRVRFERMDALGRLQFPTASFDLVNQRLGTSWLRTWDWQKVLWEYRRVARPGGIIRIVEAHFTWENNSPALTTLNTIIVEALYRSGHLFTPRGDGLTSQLAHLMREHGIQDVQTQVHPLVYQPGTKLGQGLYEDMALGLHVGLPFFQKWTRIPDNYQQIYQQALKEMQQPEFAATWTWLTVWGKNPEGMKWPRKGRYV
jgi:ubiquinone/menaquinone biosynthesis C-methylase UbiE